MAAADHDNSACFLRRVGTLPGPHSDPVGESMKTRLLFILCLVAAAAACSRTPTASPAPAQSGPFDYDASLPFDVRVVAETDREGVTVVDLNYASHDPAYAANLGGRSVAYLVRPTGEGPFAGVIYLHWLGELGAPAGVPANRGEFLDEAVDLAQQGAVCLLLQGYFPYMDVPSGDREDAARIVGQVIELRRAVDFLLAQPGVDPGRIGFVGHDYGALFGGILSGAEPRLQTYVLVAGAPSFTDFGALFGFQAEDYLPIVQDLDPVAYLPQAAPASLFFQFGERDPFLPRDRALQFYEAASDPKQIAWYDDTHAMGTPAVVQDRERWLVEKLSLQQGQ
jgi:dienelactone hydrolase